MIVSSGSLALSLDSTWSPSSEPTLQPWPTYTEAPPQASQASTEPDDPIVTAQAFLQISAHKSCSKSQARALFQAWNGAELLDQAQQKYVPGGAFLAAMQGYFGRNVEQSSWDCFWPWCLDYKKRIGDNLQRRHNLDTNKAPRSTYLYFYCEDYWNKCRDPAALGYSDTYRRGFWTTHYIVMCDNFYSRPTLSERVALAESYNNPLNYKILDAFWGTRDEAMYHSQIQMYETVCDPFINDYAHGPLEVWNLAKSKGCYWSSVNGESTLPSTARVLDLEIITVISSRLLCLFCLR